MKKIALVTLLGLVAIGLVGAGVWKWQYPYGARTCRVPCMGLALRMYAVDHGHRLPAGEPTSLRSLQKLFPEYETGHNLAGLSGNETATLARLKAGEPLDESVSSWVYWPGFTSNDNPELAILWDRQGGLLWNASRASDRGGHSVAFVDGSHRYVPGTEWLAFTNKQAAMRAAILAARSLIETNATSHVR